MHAGDERIAAFDAVREAVLDQEFECAINRDRRMPRAALRSAINFLIGAMSLWLDSRLPSTCRARRRQLLRALVAKHLGMFSARRCSGRDRDRAGEGGVASCVCLSPRFTAASVHPRKYPPFAMQQ